MLAAGEPNTPEGFGPPIVEHGSGDCDEFDISFASSLYTMGSAPGTELPVLYTSPLAKLIRGVPMTSATGCVWDGDGTPSLVPPSQYERMFLPLEGPPVSVQIATE